LAHQAFADLNVTLDAVLIDPPKAAAISRSRWP
jgi:hypothetical protein